MRPVIRRLMLVCGMAAIASVASAAIAVAQAPSQPPGGRGASGRPGTAQGTRSAAPPITLAPQINVPPAPPPTINVQPAAPAINVVPATPNIMVNPPPAGFDPTKWLALIISVISAVVAGFSARIAYLNQILSFRKDAAALLRDIQAKQASAILQAFENNVARPIGMVLDQIERMTNDMTKIAAVEPARVADEEAKYAALLAVEHHNLLRLCREADGALGPRTPVFAAAYARASVDVALYLAGSHALSGSPAAPSGTPAPLDAAMNEVGRLKIELRRVLEHERAELIRLTTDITQDPYYAELLRLLPAGIVPVPPAATVTGQVARER